MAGILDDTPVGVLDPRSMALMQMGMGLMQSSGPSLMPTSLGQSLGQAGMHGMQAFQQAQAAQQAAAFRQAQMKKMEEELLLRRMEADRRMNAPQAHGPGTQLFRPGEDSPYYTVPFKADPAPEAKPPMTRRVRIGEEDVTQEYVNGAWQEVGRGPAFAKLVQAPGATNLPKPPTGFRYKQGSDELEPIPGGPKDTAPKDAARAAGAVQKADTVIKKVDEALSQTGVLSTGLTGTVLGAIPGTKAYDLDKTIDTIKANLGFSELQAMREASPTGGALGQVAVQELSMLQSTVASLDKGQSKENLERGLTQVRTHFQNWKNAVQQAQGQQAESPAAAPLAAPKKGQVVDGWEFVGGDPGNRMNWKKK
jgi:hypothetical protein